MDVHGPGCPVVRQAGPEAHQDTVVGERTGQAEGITVHVVVPPYAIGSKGSGSSPGSIGYCNFFYQYPQTKKGSAAGGRSGSRPWSRAAPATKKSPDVDFFMAERWSGIAHDSPESFLSFILRRTAFTSTSPEAAASRVVFLISW